MGTTPHTNLESGLPHISFVCHDGRSVGLPFSIKSAETRKKSCGKVVGLSITYAVSKAPRLALRTRTLVQAAVQNAHWRRPSPTSSSSGSMTRSRSFWPRTRPGHPATRPEAPASFHRPRRARRWRLASPLSILRGGLNQRPESKRGLLSF